MGNQKLLQPTPIEGGKYTSGVRKTTGDKAVKRFNTPKDAYNDSYNDIYAKLNGGSWWVKPGTSVDEYFNRYAPAEDSNDPANYAQHGIKYFNRVLGGNYVDLDTSLSEIKDMLNNKGLSPEHEFTKMHLSIEDPSVLKDLNKKTKESTSTKVESKPLVLAPKDKPNQAVEKAVGRILYDPNKKTPSKPLILSPKNKLQETIQKTLYDPNKKTIEPKKQEVKSVSKPQPQTSVTKPEPSLLDDITGTISGAYETASNLASDVLSWGERAAVKQGVVNVTHTQPVKTVVEYKSDVKPTGVSYIGEVPGDKSNYGTFYNKFDRNVGFEYVPIKNVGKSDNKTEYSNVKGVAHFILDSDATDDYKHEYSMKYMKNQLKGINIAPGSTVKDQFLPIREKNKSNDRVKVKYKKVSELKNTDFVMSPLRQYKYTDINWNGKVPAAGFQSSVKALPTKTGEQTYFIFPNSENGKSSYGKYGGGSVVFLANNKNFAIDFAGSINDIKAMADKIIKEEKLKPEDLIIAYHDLGSFSAKPKADKSNKLKFTQWSGFNPDKHTGGGLAFPSN